jgi:hypothetical protein
MLLKTSSYTSLARRILDVHIYRWAILHEGLDAGRQIIRAQCCKPSPREYCRRARPVSPAICFATPVTLKNSFAVIVQNFSFGSEAKILLAPFDEQRLELPFQCADRLANGRLGDLVDLRSFGETLGFAQIAKNFQ